MTYMCRLDVKHYFLLLLNNTVTVASSFTSRLTSLVVGPCRAWMSAFLSMACWLSLLETQMPATPVHPEFCKNKKQTHPMATVSNYRPYYCPECVSTGRLLPAVSHQHQYSQICYQTHPGKDILYVSFPTMSSTSWKVSAARGVTDSSACSV
jgi:hypothetical protein